MKTFSKEQIIQIIKPFLGQIEINNLIDYSFVADSLTIKVLGKDYVSRIYTIALYFEGEANNGLAGDFNVK